MGERIKLKENDGFALNAYKAGPAGKPIAGVVLIQEVWGLNRWIRSEVDRYAAAGYLTVAPAMMDRVELGYESEDYGHIDIERRKDAKSPAKIEPLQAYGAGGTQFFQ